MDAEAAVDMSEEPPRRRDGSDPDLNGLEQLPAPPRRMRSISVAAMLFTVAAALLLAWSLRSEASYATSAAEPTEIGQLATAKLGTAVANRFVRARAELDVDRAIDYRRMGDSDGYRIAPVRGVEGVWVEYRVPDGMSGRRFLPPHTIAGRLVRSSKLGARYSGVRGALGGADAWVLVDGNDPQSSAWVVALEVLLLLFVAWNIGALWRVLRPVGDA